MINTRIFRIALHVVVWCAVIGPVWPQANREPMDSVSRRPSSSIEPDATAARSIVLCDVDQPQVYLHVVYKPELSDCPDCTDDTFKAEKDRTDVEYAAIISSTKSTLMRFPNGYSPSIRQSRETHNGVEMYCVSAAMPDGMAFRSLAPQVLRSGDSQTREYIANNTYHCDTWSCSGPLCCPSGYCLTCYCGHGNAGCDPEDGFIIDARLVPFRQRYI